MCKANIIWSMKHNYNLNIKYNLRSGDQSNPAADVSLGCYFTKESDIFLMKFSFSLKFTIYLHMKVNTNTQKVLTNTIYIW
jgi:hypothetical protein